MTFKNMSQNPPAVGERILALTPSFPRDGEGSDMRWRVMTWSGTPSSENPITHYQAINDLELGLVFDLACDGADPMLAMVEPKLSA